MYLCKRVYILSKIVCRGLCKTISTQINFPFFFLKFCSGCDFAFLYFLENFKLVLLIRLPNAGGSTFPANETVRLAFCLYVQNNYSK